MAELEDWVATGVLSRCRCRPGVYSAQDVNKLNTGLVDGARLHFESSNPDYSNMVVVGLDGQGEIIIHQMNRMAKGGIKYQPMPFLFVPDFTQSESFKNISDLLLSIGISCAFGVPAKIVVMRGVSSELIYIRLRLTNKSVEWNGVKATVY